MRWDEEGEDAEAVMARAGKMQRERAAQVKK